jgi:glycosyltransferase involved in cell wall biosynthesis
VIDTHVNLIHAHNLHGAGTGFFDLRALPELGRRVPVVLTLHDAWLLAGHCAHSFDCDRWERGCGRCPYLSVPEMIRRDGSVANFALKQHVFERCSLRIAAPSQWLMDRAQRSLLGSAIAGARVIPNGIDLECFHPGDKLAERRRLDLDENTHIILCVGNTLAKNTWRDFESALAATRQVARRQKGKTLLLGLGEGGAGIVEEKFELRLLPHRADSGAVAAFLRAADVYLHSSRADTFPTVILEAMACGLPVVATAVGGIPEQVVDGETGVLVEPGNVSALAQSLSALLDDHERGRRFGKAATLRASRDFGLDLMVDRYIDWYHELIDTESTPN